MIQSVQIADYCAYLHPIQTKCVNPLLAEDKVRASEILSTRQSNQSIYFILRLSPAEIACILNLKYVSEL